MLARRATGAALFRSKVAKTFLKDCVQSGEPREGGSQAKEVVATNITAVLGEACILSFALLQGRILHTTKREDVLPLILQV